MWGAGQETRAQDTVKEAFWSCKKSIVLSAEKACGIEFKIRQNAWVPLPWLF